MGLFSFKRKRHSRQRSARFRARYFQQRISRARNYKRTPRIVPRAKTKISLRARAFRFTIFKIVFVALVLIIGYFLIISDVFLVKEVSVLGNEQVQSDKIESWIIDSQKNRAWKLVPKNHILLLNTRKVKLILSENTPYIFDVSKMSRRGFSQIEITVEERVPLAIWEANEKFFYIDKLGIAYEQVDPGYATTTENYIKIEDTTQTPVSAGEDLKISQALQFFQDVISSWANNIESNVDYVKIPGKFGQEIQFFAKEGWAVLFDITADSRKQVLSLRLILDQEIPPERRREVAYIDLRLPSTAYYCYKGEPCSALQTESPPVE